MGSVGGPISSFILSVPLKLQYIPVTRVENICATGTEAVRAASYAVAAGMYDLVLAVGVQKLKDTGFSGLGRTSFAETPVPEYEVPPGMFAFMANRYFYHYGINHDVGKRLLAQIAVKNHHNGSLHPKAHFQGEIMLEQAINAPIAAWPLGLYDCCGVTDGAAAAIVTRADLARKFRQDPIYIKALSICSGFREGVVSQKYDYLHVEESVRAAKAAYAEAGIKDPFRELSIAELHDCFTITEMVTYEDLGWCPRGGAKDYVEGGVFSLEGELPVNTDGGLKCFGHPIGASGLRMIYEVYKQLQEKAGPRQVKNAELGLTHNLAGGPGQAIVSICILGHHK